MTNDRSGNYYNMQIYILFLFFFFSKIHTRLFPIIYIQDRNYMD